jgi:nucleoid-associated protein YgaU
MFDPGSRYYNLETVKLEIIDGDGKPRVIAYKRRRFIPAADGQTTLVEHTVTQGERLDNITARYLGDPLQFWRICDANNALNPEELTDETGRTIAITMPQL